jgi:hypothetical protein
VEGSLSIDGGVDLCGRSVEMLGQEICAQPLDGSSDSLVAARLD